MNAWIFTVRGDEASLRAQPDKHAGFGVILWEMASLVTAFERFTKDLFITEVLAKGNRLPIPVDWPAEFSYLITHCWAHEWQDRPSAAFVVTHLRALLQVCI
jgi:hypothetical protein